jgi:MerR family transcriptional regulator, light-induced transcriptional regulator
MTPAADELRIRDVVERTGVPEATLRAWEQRYGFPRPQRLPSGHRRYAAADLPVLREVVRLRDAGLPVSAAIERARAGEAVPRSVFAGVRRLRPELPVNVLPKRSLIALGHAIEDESAWAAEDLLLFGAFQRERHYRETERRWRELARAAQTTFVFADFARPRRPRGGPVEVPIAERDPLAREWAIVCDSSDRAACLVGWEPPGQQAAPDHERLFETVWTVDRGTARGAARICCELAAHGARARVEPVARRLAEPVVRADDDLRRAEALTSRMIAYLTAGGRPGGPSRPTRSATAPRR